MTGEEYAKTIKCDGTAITSMRPHKVLTISVANVIELVQAAYDAGKADRDNVIDGWVNHGWGEK